MVVVYLTAKSNKSGGFYFNEEVGFEPKLPKNKKKKGDDKNGKGENKKTKQKK